MEGNLLPGSRRQWTPALLAWLRLARVFGRIDRATAAHLRGWGLTVAQVGAAEGLTQGELARALFVTKGNVSQLVDRMEQGGLVTRCQEGQVKRLALTDKGRDLYDDVVPAQEGFIAAQLGALAPDEQRRLHHLLRTLDKGLSATGCQQAGLPSPRVERSSREHTSTCNGRKPTADSQ